MKAQLIDILAENIQELEKEEIASALEIPKKSDMGDFAFPCFKLAKVYRKAPNMIAEDLTKKILEKNYDIFSKVENVGGYINFFFAKEEFAKQLVKTIGVEDFGASMRERERPSVLTILPQTWQRISMWVIFVQQSSETLYIRFILNWGIMWSESIIWETGEHSLVN